MEDVVPVAESKDELQRILHDRNFIQRTQYESYGHKLEIKKKG